MRLLVDMNVLLDAVLKRGAWADDAVSLLAAIERRDVEALVAGHTVTTIYYLTAKLRDRASADDAVRMVLDRCEVVPMTHGDFSAAFELGFRDFEDAVQAIAAQQGNAALIVTRNVWDFARSPVPARTPSEILALL